MIEIIAAHTVDAAHWKDPAAKYRNDSLLNRRQDTSGAHAAAPGAAAADAPTAAKASALVIT
jgi:hypothetical protein